jgi:hypothetical protein
MIRDMEKQNHRRISWLSSVRLEESTERRSEPEQADIKKMRGTRSGNRRGRRARRTSFLRRSQLNRFVADPRPAQGKIDIIGGPDGDIVDPQDLASPKSGGDSGAVPKQKSMKLTRRWRIRTQDR